jgi:VIT1/CCC1 family predicted Fe2+/Mn2+ transporter
MPKAHKEPHRIKAIGWLRAAVLGANDGIISTASLIIGVASAHAEHGPLVLTGLAGLVAGAMSMATGEYVSVSSQADTETAALAEEQTELDGVARASIEIWRRFTCGAVSLAIPGGLAAPVGGAKVGPGALRVTFWSALSMGVTSAVGAIFGAT